MINHFDFIASFYDRFSMRLDSGRLHDLLKLPVDGLMLDAGGGTGRVSFQFRSEVEKVVISDLSLPMLKQARIKGDIYAVRTHVERLPFTDASFDRILVVDALHHFCDQQKAIHDLIRVLKPGGRIVIEEPDINRVAVKLAAFAEKISLMRSHFSSAAEILEMFKPYPVSARVINDGHFFFWIVAEK